MDSEQGELPGLVQMLVEQGDHPGGVSSLGFRREALAVEKALIGEFEFTDPGLKRFLAAGIGGVVPPKRLLRRRQCHKRS